MFGFYKIAIAEPQLKIANPPYNASIIVSITKKAERQKASIILFPELSISTYSCGDFFANAKLIDETEKEIAKICQKLKNCPTIAVFGAPLFFEKKLYNCAIAVQRGKILGIVPKSFIPNYKEFYEKRWFQSGKDIKNKVILTAGQEVPFGTDLLFTDSKDLSFAIEICEDLWLPIPPSSHHAIAGANLILNLSASNEIIGKSDYRLELIKHQSAKCICAYAFCSAGTYESSTDTVFGGHCALFENGQKIFENERFGKEERIHYTDIDLKKINFLRLSESSFNDQKNDFYRKIIVKNLLEPKNITRSYDPHPFVPSDKSKRDERCREIFHIQSSAIARRFEHTRAQKAVIGISGGLDSTLALLAVKEAFSRLNRDTKNIIAITMPGFGTSSGTFRNASELAKILNCDFRKIDIRNSCKIHLKDIGKNINDHDTTFENAQARERTQILMDIANAENGIVIGTGDLSEIALGWSTFNGDHISMYSANCGIPKTLVRHIVKWVAEKSESILRKILQKILATPISPELIPPQKNGKISQETEKIIGSYELHDFFLYHHIKYGAEPEKIKLIAKIAFKNKYSETEINNTLKIFLKRFFSQQFKRNCCPDGPKVGTIALSPRSDWRMPSDADPALWLKDL